MLIHNVVLALVENLLKMSSPGKKLAKKQGAKRHGLRSACNTKMTNQPVLSGHVNRGVTAGWQVGDALCVGTAR